MPIMTMNNSKEKIPASPTPRIEGILESCLYASDLDAARSFYETILGLHIIVEEAGRHIFFRCGAGVFLLFNPERTRSEAGTVNGSVIPLHGSEGPGHLAFRVSLEAIPAWCARLSEAKIPIESEVEWPGGGRSVYVRDPAGNSVELGTGEMWGLPPLP